MVRGIEDLRTPLSTILQLDKELRGTLSGFMMPAFVIDLPGGGGKRLVSSKESYCETTGVATYRAPGLPGEKGTKLYTYYDPKPVNDYAVEELRQEQEQALKHDMSLQDVANPTLPRPGSSKPNPGKLRQMPPFIYNPSLPRIAITTKARQAAVKPEDLAPHIGASNWQPSSAAAA